MTLWTVARQAPLTTGFSGQEYWSRLPLSICRGSSQPWDQTQVSCIAGDSLPSEPPGKLWVIHGVLSSELPFSQEAGSLTWDSRKLNERIFKPSDSQVYKKYLIQNSSHQQYLPKTMESLLRFKPKIYIYIFLTKKVFTCFFSSDWSLSGYIFSNKLRSSSRLEPNKELLSLPSSFLMISSK